LKKFLSGTQRVKFPEDAFRALDTIMREMPSFYYTPVGRSFFPFDGQGTPLGEGCEVHFGFYSRVGHSEWKAMLVNIDGKQDGDVDKLVYVQFRKGKDSFNSSIYFKMLYSNTAVRAPTDVRKGYPV